jgi:hypothetical protein
MAFARGVESQQIVARMVNRISEAPAEECGRRCDGEQNGTRDLGADGA